MVESQNRIIIEFCVIFLRLYEQDVFVRYDILIDMTCADFNEIFFVSVFAMPQFVIYIILLLSRNYSKTSFVCYDGGRSMCNM